MNPEQQPIDRWSDVSRLFVWAVVMTCLGTMAAFGIAVIAGWV